MEGAMQGIIGEYDAPMDGLTKGVTVFVIGLLAGIFSIMLLTIPIDETGTYWLFFFVGVLYFFIPFIAYIYTPTGFSLFEDRIEVKRPIGSVMIQLSTISKVYYSSDGHELRKAMRLWGNGGLWGFTGLYKHKEIGKYKAYSRTSKEIVIIISKEKGNSKIIGPENPWNFTEQLTSLIEKRNGW